MKFFLSLAMTLFFVAVSSSCIQAQATTASADEKVTMAESTLTVKVKGVGCATDIKMIQDNVKKLDGVSNCTVLKKGATTSFEVIYLAGKVDTEKIHAAIEDTPGCEDPKDRPYKVKI